MQKKEFILELLKLVFSWPVVGFFMFVVIYSSFSLNDLENTLNTLQANGVASITVGSNSLSFDVDVPDDKIEEFEDEAFKMAVKAYEGTEEEGVELFEKINVQRKALMLAKTFDYWMQKDDERPEPTEALNEILLSDELIIKNDINFHDYLMAADELQKMGYEIDYILREDEFLKKVRETEHHYFENKKQQDMRHAQINR